MIDDFNGDNERLIACIEALLDLDEAKALVPHGIGGHARGLLSAAGVRLAAKDAEIAEQRNELSEARQDLRVYAKHQAERDESSRLLGELLAVIHRGGGQYQAEHGAAKAVKDALSKLSSLRCEHYDLQGEHEETSALLGAWKQRALQCEAERDEARECVKRLCDALRELRSVQDSDWQGYVDGALAATPEHLRG